jgi:hypothetical protein
MSNRNLEQGDRQVTIADVQKFYQDVVDGKWRGREIERDKEERRLLKALGVIK